MLKGVRRLIKWMRHDENYGVLAPKIFTSYELKLLSALLVLAVTLLWSLSKHGAQEVVGIAMIGGLAFYLSYVKYYRAYKPAMDRWGIRELCNPNHPRNEYRVADRDLEISENEVNFIARQHRVQVVCSKSPVNPNVIVYELKRSYEHRLFAERWRASSRDHRSS